MVGGADVAVETAAGVAAPAVAAGPAAGMDLGTADDAHAAGTSGDSATGFTADRSAVTTDGAADGAMAVDQGSGVAAPAVTDDTSYGQEATSETQPHNNTGPAEAPPAHGGFHRHTWRWPRAESHTRRGEFSSQ